MHAAIVLAMPFNLLTVNTVMSPGVVAFRSSAQVSVLIMQS